MQPAPDMQPGTGAELAARPKVLRRPAQFSQRDASPAAPLGEHLLPAPTAAAPRLPVPRTQARSWQEDARFGSVMVLLLLAVNVGLALLLPLLAAPTPPAETPGIVILDKAATLPTQVRQRSEGVTLYAQPEAPQERSFNLETMPEEQSGLSTSPYDIPPPVARALDQENIDDAVHP